MGKTTGTTLLAKMGQMSQTVLWNDSCSLRELASSIEQNGTVGATCNPVIVLEVLRKEWELWKDRIPQLIRNNPAA
jgi:transaldolase